MSFPNRSYKEQEEKIESSFGNGDISNISIKMTKEDYHDHEDHHDDHDEHPLVGIDSAFPIESAKGSIIDSETPINSTAATSLSSNFDPPDGGYGWCIVAVAFLVSVLSDGCLYSFGIYMPIYISIFNSQPATVSWIGSFGSGASCLLGLFAGYYADKYGNKKVLFLGGLISSLGYLLASFSTELWHLFFTQGLLCGVGFSLSYTSAFVVVGQWFSKHRGLAVGISVCGSGIGVFIMVQVQSLLLNQYGWQLTLRWMALIELIGMTTCSLFVSKVPMTPLSSVIKANSIAKKSMTQTVKDCYSDTHYFWLYMGYVFVVFGTGMSGHLPNYAVVNGMSTDQSRFILSMNGVASAIGRLSIGYTADHFGKLMVLRVCMVLNSIILYAWIGCVTYPALLFQALVNGFFTGGCFCLLPSICAELFGVGNLGSIQGLLYTSFAWGNTFGMPICGWLFLIQMNYAIPIALCATMFVFAALSIDYMSDKTSFVHLNSLAVVFHHDVHQEIYISRKFLEQGVLDPSIHSVESGRQQKAQSSPPKYEASSARDRAASYVSSVHGASIHDGGFQPQNNFDQDKNDFQVRSQYLKPDQNVSIIKSSGFDKSVKQAMQSVKQRARAMSNSMPLPPLYEPASGTSADVGNSSVSVHDCAESSSLGERAAVDSLGISCDCIDLEQPLRSGDDHRQFPISSSKKNYISKGSSKLSFDYSI